MNHVSYLMAIIRRYTNIHTIMRSWGKQSRWRNTASYTAKKIMVKRGFILDTQSTYHTWQGFYVQCLETTLYNGIIEMAQCANNRKQKHHNKTACNLYCFLNFGTIMVPQYCCDWTYSRTHSMSIVAISDKFEGYICMNPREVSLHGEDTPRFADQI